MEAEFARRLRERGIPANATERAVRGGTGLRKRDGIYRAMQRGVSDQLRRKADEVVGELAAGWLLAEPGKSKLIATRTEVENGWDAVAALRDQSGRPDLARDARAFVDRLAHPRTDREWIADRLLSQQRSRQFYDLAR